MKKISTTTISLCVAATVIAAAVAGCGGDSGSTGATGAAGTTSAGSLPPVDAAFAKQVSTICTEGQKKVQAEITAYEKRAKSGANVPSGPNFPGIVKAYYLPGLQAQIDGIRALDVPSGDEQQVKAFLDAMQAAVDSGNEVSGTPSGTDVVNNLKPSAKLAHEYGIDACAY